VLEPLAAIEPEVVVPGDRRCIREMLDQFNLRETPR
jgi:7,8-dihydro-6-hydroxymethylpterin-pyrophosphokinase